MWSIFLMALALFAIIGVVWNPFVIGSGITKFLLTLPAYKTIIFLNIGVGIVQVISFVVTFIIKSKEKVTVDTEGKSIFSN